MRWGSSLAAAALALPVVGLLGWGMTRDPREIPSPLPGRAAPTFSLATFARPKADRADVAKAGGDTVRLAALRGDVVVVNFWASWCLACRDEHEALTRVSAQYGGATDVHFVGVLYNDTPPNGLRYLEEFGGAPFPALQDPGGRTAVDYGIYGVPETFFIARDGRVAYKQTGPVTEALLLQQIEKLRREGTP